MGLKTLKVKRKLGSKRIHWSGVPLHIKQRREDPMPQVTVMTIGTGGCSRCSGFVICGADFYFEDNEQHRYLRCLICGARQYEEGAPCSSE